MKDRHALEVSASSASKECAVCGAKLSAYNENPTCWAHTLELPWKGPHTKPK